MGRGIEGSGDRFQFGLGDLAMAVLGSAFVLDVARRSRAAWGGGLPDLEHALGLAMLALTVALALIVAGRRSRRLRVGAGPSTRGARAWALSWRAAAVGWLACSVAEAAWVLQIDRAAIAASMFASAQAEARLAVVPLCIALGMIGLILAASPLRPRPATIAPPRPRAAWPSAIWAGLAGVAILAIGYETIAYLVLLALDAVSNATRRAPMIPRVPIFGRLARAGLEAAATGAACLATAAWLAEDLRRADRAPIAARRPRSWAGVLARLATAVAAAGGGLYLLLVSLPRLHPNLADGLWLIVDPTMAATIALSFAALAAGIAARGSARLAIADGPEGIAPATAAPRPWPRRLLRAAGCLIAAEVTAAAVCSIRGETDRRWYVPWPLQSWLDPLQSPIAWLGFPGTPLARFSPIDRPGDLLLLLTAPWIAVRLLALIAGGPAGPPPALDTLAVDRLARGRFLGWWAALTAVLLAAFPTFFLAGLALLHEFLRRVAG